MRKEKFTYKKPKLIIYGNFKKITKGGGDFPGETFGDTGPSG